MSGAQGDRWPRSAPLLLVPAVLVLDGVQQARAWPVPVVGLLDEPAHLATAWLGLAALAPRSLSLRAWWAALVASVVIDVDHVPLYLGDGAFSVDGGRPPTHTLVLAALLAVLAAPPRARWLLGVSAGVVLHLARDLVTGPGVPLLWPLVDGTLRLPYWSYAATLVALAVTASARAARHGPPGTGLRGTRPWGRLDRPSADPGRSAR